MISPLTSPKGLGSLNPRNNSVELCSHRLELRLQSSSLAPERRVAIRDGRPVIRSTRDCVACPFPLHRQHGDYSGASPLDFGADRFRQSQGRGLGGGVAAGQRQRHEGEERRDVDDSARCGEDSRVREGPGEQERPEIVHFHLPPCGVDPALGKHARKSRVAGVVDEDVDVGTCFTASSMLAWLATSSPIGTSLESSGKEWRSIGPAPFRAPPVLSAGRSTLEYPVRPRSARQYRCCRRSRTA
jgi:hypothetical protein